MDNKMKMQLDVIDAYTGTKSTEEQQLFASDFTKPLVSFSNPGTGKSFSIIKGLIMAQTYHKVPGKKINAMSFTIEATAELKVRYDKACKLCGMTPTVQFNTFHKICKNILCEEYPRMKIVAGFNMEEDLTAIQHYLKESGVEIDDMNRLKKILKAIDSLNHALIYDGRHVELSYAFKSCNIPLSAFQQVRASMFFRGIQRQTIAQGDIPMYALYVLVMNPAIKNKYLNMFKIMIVDEFQDMTKLYLTILSMISNNLIVIGDIKQQIYGFNGACSEIVEEYMKMYPNARRIDLTQSFRCKNEIADYATFIYHPNDVTVKPFKGTGDGGTVHIENTSKMDLKSIVESVRSEVEYARELAQKAELGFDVSGMREPRSTMFLFRNNFSITPVAEYLYKAGVDFRIKKFRKVMDFPIYNVLSELALACVYPDNMQYVRNAIKYFPEFQNTQVDSCSFMKAFTKLNTGVHARRSGTTPFYAIEYQFIQDSSVEMMNALRRVRHIIEKKGTAKSVFETLMPIYEEFIIKGAWWKLEMEPEYYAGLVEPIVSSKDFESMISEEFNKEYKIAECVKVGVGIKCYTMHSAKGLEANDVYIMDVESTYFPSVRNIKRLIDSGCEYEAAKQVREERNLLYVGITRAKDNVYLSFTDELTSLVSNPNQNQYTYLDEIFAMTKQEFKDVEEFISLMNLGNVYDNIYHGTPDELDSLDGVQYYDTPATIDKVAESSTEAASTSHELLDGEVDIDDL